MRAQPVEKKDWTAQEYLTWERLELSGPECQLEVDEIYLNVLDRSA